MGYILIQKETTKNPMQLMGKEAGICWGASTVDPDKNYKRGLDCLLSGHGRVAEFPQVYITLVGYSARVIRELYTHIGGNPTRLQASTRYINNDNLDYITPSSIGNHPEAREIYLNCMENIQDAYARLSDLDVPREDVANILPLGMTTTVALRTNLRNLIDMAHQRLCTRAYWEFRDIMNEIMKELSKYSEEWQSIIEMEFKPKCEVCGFCTEKNTCGRKPKK